MSSTDYQVILLDGHSNSNPVQFHATILNLPTSGTNIDIAKQQLNLELGDVQYKLDWHMSGTWSGGLDAAYDDNSQELLMTWCGRLVKMGTRGIVLARISKYGKAIAVDLASSQSGLRDGYEAHREHLAPSITVLKNKQTALIMCNASEDDPGGSFRRVTRLGRWSIGETKVIQQAVDTTRNIQVQDHPTVLYPDSRSKWIYSVQFGKDASTSKGRWAIDQIPVDNLEASLTSSGMKWTRFAVSSTEVVDDSERGLTALLMLYDQKAKRTWLYVFQWSPAKIWYFRVPIREDGTVDGRDEISPPGGINETGWKDVTTGDESNRSLSVIELNGRIWLFAGVQGEIKILSAALSSESNGKFEWSLSSQTFKATERRTFWKAIKVPKSFLASW